MILKRGFPEGCKQIMAALLLLLVMMACSHDKKPDGNLQQAFKIHEDAVSLRNQIVDKLEKLNAIEDSLFVATYKESLDSISGAIEAWGEQLVEVPGFEESHDHDGHDHNHEEQPELTSEQHLQVQRHLFQEIQTIEKSINQIKEQ
ncbi:MAG: hypothetical protein ACFB2Y_09625 [Fulvivirga sp.]